MKKFEDKFVPYDLAVRLKSLGFDEMCFSYFINGVLQPSLNPKDYSYFKDLATTNSNSLNYEYVLAPLWQDAFDWFHDEFELLANIQKLPQNSYHAHIQSTSDEYLELLREFDNICIDEVGDVYTYEDVKLETLIKLIEYVEKHATFEPNENENNRE